MSTVEQKFSMTSLAKVGVESRPRKFLLHLLAREARDRVTTVGHSEHSPIADATREYTSRWVYPMYVSVR